VTGQWRIGNNSGASFGLLTATNVIISSGTFTFGGPLGPGSSNNTANVLAGTTWNFNTRRLAAVGSIGTMTINAAVVTNVGDLLWGCSNDGIVTCFDVQTGKLHYEERIGGGGQGFTASPVAANGKLYFIGEQGDVFVLPASEKFSVLATNRLEGICLATPAISEGALFFRTTENLLAIGAGK